MNINFQKQNELMCAEMFNMKNRVDGLEKENERLKKENEDLRKGQEGIKSKLCMMEVSTDGIRGGWAQEILGPAWIRLDSLSLL